MIWAGSALRPYGAAEALGVAIAVNAGATLVFSARVMDAVAGTAEGQP